MGSANIKIGTSAEVQASVSPARGLGESSRLSGRQRRQLAGWLFLTPAILYLLFAFFLPIIYNVMLSFEQTSLATIADLTAPFAGLANYRFVLNDPTSRAAIVHTFEFTARVPSRPVHNRFCPRIAVHPPVPGQDASGRSLIIVPWLLPLIVTGVIFRFLFQLEGGAVNQLLMDIGLVHHPIDWLDDPHLGPMDILIANIWLGVPFLHPVALQRPPGRAGGGQGSGPHGRCRPLAEAPPDHRADHLAGYRGHSCSSVSCSP